MPIFRVYEINDGTPYAISLDEIEEKDIIQATKVAKNKYPDKFLRVSGSGWAIHWEKGEITEETKKNLYEVINENCNMC